MTENIMTEQLYNELLKAYTKEALASMIKTDIRSRYPELYASCKADSLNAIFKQLKLYHYADLY